jgi:hypothetical protein
MYFDGGGEGGCIGIHGNIDVYKLGQGERNNYMYVLGVYLVVFSFSSRGIGRLPNRPKTKNATTFFNRHDLESQPC